MEKSAINKVRGIKQIPWYGFVGGIIFIILETVLYKIATDISMHTVVQNWSFAPYVQGLDNKIPFVPYFFIEIYFFAYGFWFITPMIISMRGKKNFINFMIYSTIASLVGFLLFCLVPTYLDRVHTPSFNIGQQIDDIKTPLTKALMTGIWNLDGDKLRAPNMCPSYHVAFSVLCSLGVLGRKDFHRPTKYVIHAIDILICCATVLVKQHFIMDILGGMLLAIIPYIAIKILNPAEKILDKHPNFLIIEKLNWKQEKIVGKK